MWRYFPTAATGGITYSILQGTTSGSQMQLKYKTGKNVWGSLLMSYLGPAEGKNRSRYPSFVNFLCIHTPAFLETLPISIRVTVFHQFSFYQHGTIYDFARLVGVLDAANCLPAKPCHTMHSNAATRFLSELGVEQLEPLVHNLIGRRGTIIKGPVLEGTKRFLKVQTVKRK